MSVTEFSPQQLQIINYPHPGLRHVAKPIRRVDGMLKEIAARMIELMYEYRGVGLAATQVNLPIRLFVWDPTGDRESGQAAVYLNPTITRPRGNDAAEEGCLSIPGVNAKVVRAKSIHMNAYTIDGVEINQDFSDFEARILQHETDHLDGVMFIDRLTPVQLKDHVEPLTDLEAIYHSRQRLGEMPLDPELIAHLGQWEQRYC